MLFIHDRKTRNACTSTSSVERVAATVYCTARRCTGMKKMQSLARGEHGGGSRPNRLSELDLPALELLSEFPCLGAAVSFFILGQELLDLGGVPDVVRFVAALLYLPFTKHGFLLEYTADLFRGRQRVQAIDLDDRVGCNQLAEGGFDDLR